MKFEKVSKEFWEKTRKEKDMMYLCSWEELKLPQRATEFSAGYDIYAPCTFTICPGSKVIFPLGIKCLLDNDKFLAITSRSGLGFKTGIRLCNTMGVIDADYYNNPTTEGMISLALDYPLLSFRQEQMTIEQGQAICQGIILSYYKVDDDNVTSKRVGGYGSTDKK